MFKHHLSFAFWGAAATGGPLQNPPGESLESGAAPAAPVEAPPAGEQGDPAADGDPADAIGDEPAGEAAPVDDNDVDDDDALVDDLPEPRVRTRLRRTQRQWKQARPVIDALRSISGDGRLPDARTVTTLAQESAYYREINDVLTRKPELLQAILKAKQELDGGDSSTAATAADPAAAESDQPTPFDESDWPFETETPQGKRMLAMARELHELKHSARQAQTLAQRATQTQQTAELATIENDWKTAAIAAAEKAFPTDVAARRLFVNNVWHQFERLKQTNRLKGTNARQVIAELAAPFTRRQATKARGAATTAARTVTNNATLPRTVRPGSTSPAPGAGAAPKTRETLADARKSFFGRLQG
jgi:hypothetical protein